MGDGGTCTLPSPPILVSRGEMRQAADEADALRARTVPSQWFQMMRATGVDGVRELVEASALDQPGVEPALVVTCSCSHVLAARDRSS